ncbi:MAG: hypothetical protein ABL983_00725 [Nitrospira sp.]
MGKVLARWDRTDVACYFFGLVMVLAISGCAENYLYNAARDKQGQAATKAASEAKLIDTVATVEKRFDGLLSLELDATKTRFAHIRELEIRELAFKTKPIQETWIDRIKQRLSRVGGTADWGKVDQLARNAEIKQELVAEHRDSFLDTFLVAAPSCDELIKDPRLPHSVTDKIEKEKQDEAARFIQRFIEPCKEFLDAQKKLEEEYKPSASSEIISAAAQLEADKKKKGKNDEVRKVAEKAVQRAIDEYTQEAKKLEKPEDKDTYKWRVVAAAKKLRDALESLEQGQDAIGMEVLAKERLNHIENVLTAVTEGNVDTSKWDEKLRKSVAVAGSIPALADEAGRILREAERPRLIPLAIAREHQRQIVDEAQKVDAVLARRVAASEKIVEAYRNELNTLLKIYNVLDAKQQRSWQSKSLPQLNKGLDPTGKRLLYELLGEYFDDVPRFQSDQRFWEYRRLATYYEETIERSKSAALMWQNLLEGVTNTLAGYHSAGIKSEDVALLLQALGVVAIGVGVNR